MRELFRKQLPIAPVPTHDLQKDLQGISQAISRLPAEVLREVDEGLREGRRGDVGRTGMSADRVIRVAVLRKLTQMGYAELAFAIDDCLSYRAFVGLGPGESAPARSTLHDNVQRLSEQHLEAIHRAVLQQVIDSGLEPVERVLVDATAVETNIHHPTDSSLLGDCVNTLTHLIVRASKLVPVPFSDHRRRAKRRVFRISNAKSKKEREHGYRDLLDTVGKTLRYAKRSVEALCGVQGTREIEAIRLRARLQQVLEHVEVICEQAIRRVFLGERLPPEEKLVSLYEPHTDIIIKKKDVDPIYGHKVYLATGASGFILDVMTPRGNPNDGQLTCKAVERVEQQTGVLPREVAFDGAFGSRENLDALKQMGVETVAFTAPRGLSVREMTGTKRLFRILCRARAGIEGTIGWLKNSFGLRRCKDSGFQSFKAYCWAAATTHNLILLARRT